MIKIKLAKPIAQAIRPFQRQGLDTLRIRVSFILTTGAGLGAAPGAPGGQASAT